jgi:formylglycine-generating enzyme required for sulfatase activity
MAKTETTQRQWESVAGDNPSGFKGDHRRKEANLPVEKVSWDDVEGWLEKMNEKTRMPSGWKWALPTEAQWEYACRAGTETEFAGTGELDEMGWYLGNAESGTERVGTKKPNAWGIHDMHGNVWEWCRDWYNGGYYGDNHTDPEGLDSGDGRVLRGGSWAIDAQFCRSADRSEFSPDYLSVILGFRPALVPSIQ